MRQRWIREIAVCRRWSRVVMHLAWAALLIVLAGNAGVSAEESLADAARREREKRKAAPPAGRTITNDDLAKYGDTPQSLTVKPEEGSDVASPQSQPSASDEPDWSAMETAWRRRFAAARQRVAEAEAGAWVDKIETVFYNGIPVQMRVREFVETVELRMARQDIERLQDELRRAGLPPGWGRD
ncbi:MAG: hypothetical protein AB1714_31530 [Acidobacteriota bacterium]